MGWLDALLGIGAAIAVGAATAIAVAAVCDYIDRRELKKQAERIARQKAPSAIKAMVLEKKKNAVDVGLFSSQNQELDRFQIKAEKGVSDDIYEGQEIPLEV